MSSTPALRAIRRTGAKITLAGIALFAIVAALLHLVSPSAPTSSEKDLRLKAQRAPAHKHTSKLSSPIEAQVVLEGKAPIRGETYVLVANIISGIDLRSVSARWVIPANAELISGDLAPSFGDTAAQEPRQARLVLRALDEDNQQVVFQIQAAVSGATVGAVAQYNSQNPRRDFLTKEEALKQGLMDDDEDHTTSRQKLFH